MTTIEKLQQQILELDLEGEYDIVLVNSKELV